MISLDKMYKTRDGREVRLYALDGRGDYPVHGATLGGEGWTMHHWTLMGHFIGEWNQNSADLVEVKPRIQREFWVNVYPDSKDDILTNVSYGFKTKEAAIASSAEFAGYDEVIACVKLTIDCEEGEGL